MTDSPIHTRAEEYFSNLQDTICKSVGSLEGMARFREDRWSHPEGGGGTTRIIEAGNVFEKGGVNFSAVTGRLTPKLAAKMNVPVQGLKAAGISLVLHPVSPMIPTVHMNLRHLELDNGDAWFGGGADLTPSYLFEADATHFHRTLKSACDTHDPRFYPEFKQGCDDYFFLPHRGETRGVGGVFFDYLREDAERIFRFVQEIGNAFLPAYTPIVRTHDGKRWTPEEKEWQLIRRGRYVEFNLLYDRGTLFGLETGGRTESILMSLPPEVKWQYDAHPKPDSREAALLNVLQHPRSWID